MVMHFCHWAFLISAAILLKRTHLPLTKSPFYYNVCGQNMLHAFCLDERFIAKFHSFVTWRTAKVLPRQLTASAGADVAVRWALPPLAHSHTVITSQPLPPKEFLAGVWNMDVLLYLCRFVWWCGYFAATSSKASWWRRGKRCAPFRCHPQLH